MIMISLMFVFDLLMLLVPTVSYLTGRHPTSKKSVSLYLQRFSAVEERDIG